MLPHLRICSCLLLNSPLCFTFRNLRTASRRVDFRKVQGTVRTVTEYDDDEFSHIDNYKDFVKSVSSSLPVDETEIERAFSSRDDFGTALRGSSYYRSASSKQGPEYRSFVKKQIIRRKYFKTERETNLLTHAAKTQIQYLHKLDPLEWSAENLAQSFPISVSGVKKLLRSNFVHTSEERIRQHDEEVMERWRSLRSGNPSELISPRTQLLWNRGEILQDFYSGNPNLPAAPSTQKVLKEDDTPTGGEFSSILKNYIKHKNRQQLKTDSQIADGKVIEMSSQTRIKNEVKVDTISRSSRYHIDDEEAEEPIVKKHQVRYGRGKFGDDTEMPVEQFKKNLKDEIEFKRKFRKQTSWQDEEYENWLDSQSSTSKPKKTNLFNEPETFRQISKYKNDGIGNAQDISERYGLKDKPIKNRITVPVRALKKNTTYRVGKCIYDEDGEFLYKIPI